VNPEVCGDFVLDNVTSTYDSIIKPDFISLNFTFNHSLMKFPLKIKEDFGFAFTLSDGS
jgi:hypothetical protein